MGAVDEAKAPPVVDVDPILSEDQLTPECRSVKTGLRAGRWAVNPRDSNRLDLVRVIEPASVDDDETAEIAFPTCVVPTDGAN